jgi:hypothetical protein
VLPRENIKNTTQQQTINKKLVANKPFSMKKAPTTATFGTTAL